MPGALMDDLWLKMSQKPGRYDVMKGAVDTIIALGYPLSSVIMHIHDVVISHTTLSDVDKAVICEKLAQVCIGYLYIIYTAICST